MNLLQISKQYGRDVKEIEEFLKTQKGIKTFDPSFPVSDSIAAMIEEHYKKTDHFEGDSTVLADSCSEGEYDDYRSPFDVNHRKADEAIYEDLFSNPSVKLMESCLENGFHIVIDTSSILRKKNAFRRFYKECKPLLLKYKKELEIPYSVIGELGRILVNGEKDKRTIERVQLGVELIKNEIKEGNIKVLGDRENMWKNNKGGEDFFADADFTVQILKWRNQGESVLLITQDYEMTKDILKISDISSIQSRAEVLVRKLNAFGQLVNALDEPLE